MNLIKLLRNPTTIPMTLLVAGLGFSTWVHSSEKLKSPMQHIDTLIPMDHVLVPLELTNPQVLSQFSGSTMRADLYFGGKKIIGQAKIIRAPKNPNLYAVLVHETKAKQIVVHPGPLRISLRNPKRKSPVRKKIRSRINYGNDL